MAAEIEVRPATAQDIVAIVGLWKEFMAFHRKEDSIFTLAPDGEEWFAQFVEGNIDSEAACVYVAVVNGRLVGYCQAKADRYPPVIAEPDYGQILDVAVTADYRRAGVGEKMFRALYDWFSLKGVHRIEVRHWKSNEVAANFWRKMGFQPCLETLFMQC